MDNRSPAIKEDTQRNKAEVLRLRRQRMTFEKIGQELGFSRQRAHQIYKEALAEIPVLEVNLYRAEQREILDDLVREARAVLERDHITVSNGKVITVDGEPLIDDGPKLAAIREIRALEESRRKLDGVDAPVKQELSGDVKVRYEVVGVNLEDLT